MVGLFFRADGDKITANVVIADLTSTPPSGYSAVRYRVYVTVGGTIRYVQALVGGGTPAFTYGSELQATYTEDGQTTGAIHEGKNGVIEIVIPADAGGKPGTKLDATSSSVGLMTFPGIPAEAMLPPFYLQTDTAPDGAADGPSTTPAPCSAAAGSAAAKKTTAPATAARVSLKGSTISAKKANAKRSASLVLQSSGPLTSVTASLKRGSTSVGSGSLAKLSGSGTLKLKLKGKLKKGAHKLRVTGKRADGSTLSAAFKITVGS